MEPCEEVAPPLDDKEDIQRPQPPVHTWQHYPLGLNGLFGEMQRLESRLVGQHPLLSAAQDFAGLRTVSSALSP